MERIIRPVQSLRGEISVPGDKSISHRALLIGSISKGEIFIRNPATGKDVESTRACLKSLGVSIYENAGGIRVSGQGLFGYKEPAQILNAGNSGTTIRLLSGILSAQSFSSRITGDISLQKRDMKRIIEPLGLMGGKVSSRNGFAPLHIQGSKLHGISYQLPVASAQVKSCLLLAGLHAAGETVITEPAQTRDHTERMLRYLGVPVKQKDLTLRISSGIPPRAGEIIVPGDFSSAAFFLAAAFLVPDSEVALKNVSMNSTRAKFLDVLKSMGANFAVHNQEEKSGEPRADILSWSSELTAVELNRNDIPILIDEIPALAVLATQARGTTVIRGAKELRQKESDRIQAIVSNLMKMGANAEELPDGMRIRGPSKLRGARIKSYHDHRIIMAFAVAGLIAEGETILEDAEWAEISFPDFFKKLRSLQVENR